MIVASFDIGVTGAVAFVDRSSAKVFDLPILIVDGFKRLDGLKLVEILRTNILVGEAAMAMFENVMPRPNAGRGTTMHSEGSLMRFRGAIECALDVTRIPMHTVSPQKWQKSFGLVSKSKKGTTNATGLDPSDPRPIAMKLYPGIQEMFKRVKDHNRADAVLIGHWAHRMNE